MHERRKLEKSEKALSFVCHSWFLRNFLKQGNGVWHWGRSFMGFYCCWSSSWACHPVHAYSAWIWLEIFHMLVCYKSTKEQECLCLSSEVVKPAFLLCPISLSFLFFFCSTYVFSKNLDLRVHWVSWCDIILFDYFPHWWKVISSMERNKCTSSIACFSLKIKNKFWLVILKKKISFFTDTMKNSTEDSHLALTYFCQFLVSWATIVNLPKPSS